MLINEVAKMANMSKDGVRHYEQLGLITSTPRQAGGRVYREYDLLVLERIEQVRQAQQLGFTLKEIGPLLKAHAVGPISKEATIEFLEARLVVIREKLAAIQAVEAFICNKLERYREPIAIASPIHEPVKVAPSKRILRARSMAEPELPNRAVAES